MAKPKNEPTKGTRPGVTEATYLAESMAYLTANGVLGKFLLVRPMADPASGSADMAQPHNQELGAWLKYFQIKRMREREKWFKEAIKRQGFYCLPTTWPWQFDSSVDELMMGEIHPYRDDRPPDTRQIPAGARGEQAARARDMMRATRR
jgi:hypothetical protein